MSERNGMKDDDERLAGRAKALFDESVHALDAETLSKLNRGRQRALSGTRAQRPGSQWSRWMPPAVAAAAAAAVVIALWPERGDRLPQAAPGDVEILLAEEELEMLEDLEFYRWMAVVEQGGVGDDVG